MLANRFSKLLCASLALSGATAWADEADLFVVQLRLPARGVTLDVFAARTANGIEAPGSALVSMGILAPNSDDLVPLSSIPGLTYAEAANDGAIVITCEAACFEAQRIDFTRREQPAHALDASSTGGYLNYEADVQWPDDYGVAASGIAEVSFFGGWGLIESSWLGQSNDGARFTRLETTWTIDAPRHGVRTRLGDSVMIGATAKAPRS